MGKKLIQCWLTASFALVTTAFLLAGSASAAIDWNYLKPKSERSVGSWISDILGLSDFGRDYAVIIGLHQFEDFNPLDATENDPARVFEFLRDEAGFDNILMLRDKEVTHSKLRRLFLTDLPRVLTEKDRFLLFWSGHGTQFTNARGNELGYLPLTSSPADDKSTMIAMRDLERWDNELPAKHALFLLDACFSGLAGKAKLSDDRDLEIRELSKPGHHIISAGGRDQQTIASRQQWQGSIFTHGLLKALRGDADRYGGNNGGDGVINLHELVAHMGETVKNAKAEAGWKRPLRPILNVFRGEGQFFFLTRDRKRNHLETKGLRVSNTWSFGMPVVMGVDASTPDGRESPPTSAAQLLDEAIWNGIKDSNDPAEFEIFIHTYPESPFVPFAKRRLDRLDPSQRAALSEETAAGSQTTFPQSATPSPVTVETALSFSRADKRKVQLALTTIGFDTRGTDGIFGKNTRRAIEAWQHAEDLEPTGYLTSKQHEKLLTDAELLLAQAPVVSRMPDAQSSPIEPAVGLPSSESLTTFRDCGDCPEMVVIPAGAFLMGSHESDSNSEDDERPRHRVSLSSFAIGKYEISFDEWEACRRAKGCKRMPYHQGWGALNRPIIEVGWDDANEYAEWLSDRTGEEYRLPSEAEWEYAARAGTETSYALGDNILVSQANYDDSYVDESQTSGYRRQTFPVGSFQPNRFDLYDMHGNVAEWVEDLWHENFLGAPDDGSPWTDGSSHARVIRGGSWISHPNHIRSASRHGMVPNTNAAYIGFRIAKTLTP